MRVRKNTIESLECELSIWHYLPSYRLLGGERPQNAESLYPGVKTSCVLICFDVDFWTVLQVLLRHGP